MKILYTLPALDGGGIDKILYDYTLRFSGDMQCDFLVHTDYEGILESDLKKRGYNIYHVPPLHKDRKRYISDIKSIMKRGNYDIVHVNQGFKGLFYLYFAKRGKINVRIAHSHMANSPERKKEYMIRKISTFFVKWLSTHLFACGDDAAKWMWGERDFSKGRVYIMKNAIDVECFSFSLDKRERLRKELGIEDKFVIGNVARFSDQKNHEFLIRLFYEIKKLRKNAVLMLVGRGELEEDIKNQVAKFGLQDSVLFMGIRNDVYDLLNVMDIFVLPSKYEGLPVTLLEIQANGLSAVVSDAVTKEMALFDGVHFISLHQPVEDWVKVILEEKRTNSYNLLKGTSYDLDIAVGDLYGKYLSIL